MKVKCGCTADFLCNVAKKLWKYKSFKGRKAYSDHRCIAFGETESNGVTYRANNSKNEN